MRRATYSELEFDKLLELVAAHARTRVGRLHIQTCHGLAPPTEAQRAADLTNAVTRLLEEDGPLTLAGLDEAEPWLEPGATIPFDPGELLDLLRLARRIAAVRQRLLGAPPELELLHRLGHDLPDTRALVDWAAPLLGRDGQVPDEASPELARLRRQATRLRIEVVARLEDIRRANSGTVTDAPPTVRRDRYCLPVHAQARAHLPGLLLDVSGTGATAFVEPFNVVEMNNDLALALARETEEVRRIVAEVAAAFGAIHDDLRRARDVLAVVDAAQARTLFGRAVDGRVVTPTPGRDLVLVGARHPLLDERMADLRHQLFSSGDDHEPDRRAVPLDLRLPDGVATLVVSGPNAGGKTVVLKTVGLMVLMASHGIPLPVDDGTTLPPFARLWCHIGDEQDVAADLSTFSGAMAATADLLQHGDAATLVLYDELGAGTDPLEGAALGCAILEEVSRRGCVTIATTHLASIAMVATADPTMDNAAMEYDESVQLPTYRLRLGRPGRSRGLEIAQRMAMPPSVLDRARDLLGGQHLELDRWLRRLEELETDLLRERQELAATRLELEGQRAHLDRREQQLEDARAQLPVELAAERDRLRRRAKQQLDDGLAKLDEAIRENEKLGKRRRERLRQEALELETPAPQPAGAARSKPGDLVRVDSLGTDGELVEIRGSRALVTIRGKRMWVESDGLQPAVRGAAESKPARRTAAVEVDVVADHELKLLGLDGESARDEVERFLDRALAAGRPSVRIVHGHGTGTLRNVVRDVCRTHPAVRGFRHPPQHMGGKGATEVELVGGSGD